MGAYVRVRRRGAGVAFAALLAVPLVVRCATRDDTPGDRSARPAPRQTPVALRLARLAPPPPREPDWRIGRVPSVRLEGEVLMDGEPVAGAEVRVGVAPGSIEPAAAVTDALGRFDLGERDPLRTHVVARLGDRRDVGAIDLAEHVARGRAFLTLDLGPCESRVTGRLVDSARRPLAGVAVHERLGRDPPVTAEAGRSGADGQFAVCGWSVTAGGGSFARVAVRGPDAGDVILRAPLTVHGRVIRAGGEAVAGAIVTVTPVADEEAEVTARGDRDGAWSAEVASGCVALSATHRGQQAVVILPGGEERSCGFSPPPTAVCGFPGTAAVAPPIVLERCDRAARGVVRVAGKPAAGLVVTVGDQRDLTDDDGGFSFPCAAGDLEVAGHDLARRPPTLDGEEANLELDATPSQWIRGRVTLAGRPVHGARVLIGSMEEPFSHIAATTARDGSYALQVAQGTVPIWALGPGGVATAPPHREVVAAAGAPPIRVDLAMGIPAAVQGVVRTADGTPVPGVPVLLYHHKLADRHSLGMARTDARGFFQLAPAPGRYALAIGEWRWQLARGGHLAHGGHLPLTVTEGGALDLDVVVEPFVDDDSE